MSEPAVVFDGVCKKFRRGERHDSLRDLLPAIASRLVNRKDPTVLEAEDFWAVDDVSFTVEPGRALGIIGPNGAGKSTILKLLTRILRPTKGTCHVHGRIGALIEVSAGFHPDLTGRENISLQGAVMGMKQAEIARVFDAIVEFSGLASFIDTPIKRYSSGMNARLGFSIAAHLNPEVLIIDEVLAVGDASFQQRCFERIRALRRSGVTFIFVSHNLAAVEALCDETVVMWKGRAIFQGEPQRATSAYLNPPDACVAHARSSTFERRGNGAVEVEDVRLLGPGGQEITHLTSGSRMSLECVLRCVTGPREVVVRFSLIDQDKTLLFGENGSVKTRPLQMQTGERAQCRIDIASLPMPAGTYYFTVAAHSAFTQDIYDWHEAAYSIRIDTAEDLTRIGSIGLATTWTLNRLDDSRVQYGGG